MKKTYLNPETQVVAMMPQSIICTSITEGNGGTQSIQTPGSDTGGGQTLPVIGN